MKKTIYIFPEGNQWKVKCDHCRTISVDARSTALDAAKRHSLSLKKRKRCKVIIQEGKDKYYVKLIQIKNSSK